MILNNIIFEQNGYKISKLNINANPDVIRVFAESVFHVKTNALKGFLMLHFETKDIKYKIVNNMLKIIVDEVNEYWMESSRFHNMIYNISKEYMDIAGAREMQKIAKEWIKKVYNDKRYL